MVTPLSADKKELATRGGFKHWRTFLVVVAIAALGYYVYQLTRPPETQLTKAARLLEQGRAADAMEMLERLSKEEPDNADVFPWLAQGYLATDRYAEGRTALDTALRLKVNPTTLGEVVQKYSEYYQRRGDYDEAEKLYQSAARVVPIKFFDANKSKMYLAWAESDMQKGDLRPGVRHLQLAHSFSDEVDPQTKSMIPHRLAECYRRLAAIAETRDKNDLEAINLLESSLKVADEPLTRISLASIYARTGRIEPAIEHYTAVSEKDPNNLEVRHHLIEILLAKKDFERAQQALAELTEREKSVENYELLADINLKIGNYAGAVRALEEASTLRPSVPLLTKLKNTLLSWSELLYSEKKTQEGISVKGHADRIAEQIAKMTNTLPGDEKVDVDKDKWNPGKPPIAILFSRNWLMKESLTPEGKLKIKNISGAPVKDLSLTAVFYDHTARKSNGSVGLPVAGPSSPPFEAEAEKWLYFSCPNTVKYEHQLAVIILWKGKFLKEFPVVKRL